MDINNLVKLGVYYVDDLYKGSIPYDMYYVMHDEISSDVILRYYNPILFSFNQLDYFVYRVCGSGIIYLNSFIVREDYYDVDGSKLYEVVPDFSFRDIVRIKVDSINSIINSYIDIYLVDNVYYYVYMDNRTGKSVFGSFVYLHEVIHLINKYSNKGIVFNFSSFKFDMLSRSV